MAFVWCEGKDRRERGEGLIIKYTTSANFTPFDVKSTRNKELQTMGGRLKS